MSRRRFVQMAAAGTGAAAMLAAFHPQEVSAKVPKKWDEEADIIVVGAGGAGLAGPGCFREHHSRPLRCRRDHRRGPWRGLYDRNLFRQVPDFRPPGGKEHIGGEINAPDGVERRSAPVRGRLMLH